MAHIRQPNPDSGLGFQVKVLDVVASWLGSGPPEAPHTPQRRDLYGTFETVKARLWPWLSGRIP